MIEIDDEGVGTWMGGIEMLVGEELFKGRFLKTLRNKRIKMMLPSYREEGTESIECTRTIR